GLLDELIDAGRAAIAETGDVGAHGHAPLLLVPQEMRELREQARDLLVQAGMQEVITYSLVSMEDLERVLPSREGPSHYVGTLARAGRVSEELGPLAVANPMSREHQYLRPTLRSSLLRTLARNRRLGADGLLALFEVGRIYMPQPGELPREVETLTGVIAGEERPTWHGRGRKADFYEARGYVELLMDGLGLEAGFAPVDEPALLPGRIGAILVAGERVGLLGQLHPRVVAAFELDEEVYLFEIDLEALLPHRGGPRRYRPLPRFPAVVEDIALIVDEETPAARVQGILLEEPLVAQASLFDVYRGEPVPAGKMSLAFTISYRAPDRTLTDRDVVEARLRLMERLSREVGATLRG
ncbi:MAG TPA: hypothetical protein VJ256_07745, partial [Dehalococcoidia bacterium]|nr:hypothetical protein [Dehalococcoidia bacterium]